MIKDGTILNINGREGAVIANLIYENENYINVVFYDAEDDNYIYKVTPEAEGFKLEKETNEDRLAELVLSFAQKVAKDLCGNE